MTNIPHFDPSINPFRIEGHKYEHTGFPKSSTQFNSDHSMNHNPNQQNWRGFSIFSYNGYIIRSTKGYYTAEYQQKNRQTKLGKQNDDQKIKKKDDFVEKCRFHCGQTFQNGAGLKEHEITHMQLVLTLHQKHKDKLFSEKAKTRSRDGLKFRNQQKAPKPLLKNNQNRRGKPY